MIAPQPEAVREEAVERARRRRAGARWSNATARSTRPSARWRASRSLRGQGGAGAEFSDFAILYRANHQARVFEQALRKAQIPYKVSGGQSFFDRAEIKDLCAWLRLLVNNDDDPAFLRAVTTPKRGIGHQTLAEPRRVRRQVEDEPVRGAVRRQPAHARCATQGDRIAARVRPLRQRPANTARATPIGAEDAKALLLDWLKDIDYEQHLHDGEDSEKLAAARWTNVLDFVDWIAQALRRRDRRTTAARRSRARSKSVLEVAQTISRDRQPGRARRRAERRHAVDAARGQGPRVAARDAGRRQRRAAAVSSSEDDEMTPQRLEEERRLMYVGITRARTTLAVSTLRRRKRGRETVPGMPSRFIAEMKLHEAGPKEDPREKLKALREAARARAAGASAARSRPTPAKARLAVARCEGC